MTAQQRYMDDLLGKWRQRRRAKLGAFGHKEERPLWVRDAQKMIDRWHKKIAKWERGANLRYQKRMDALDKEYRVAREKMLFDDPKAALKFIKSLPE